MSEQPIEPPLENPEHTAFSRAARETLRKSLQGKSGAFREAVASQIEQVISDLEVVHQEVVETTVGNVNELNQEIESLKAQSTAQFVIDKKIDQEQYASGFVDGAISVLKRAENLTGLSKAGKNLVNKLRKEYEAGLTPDS